MFTHPALLRQLKLTAALSRRAGEMDWSRRLIQASDHVRKHGWTEQGRDAVRHLFAEAPALEGLNFGVEHERRLGGPEGVRDANLELLELRQGLLELSRQATREPIDPKSWRPRSPDLA